MIGGASPRAIEKNLPSSHQLLRLVGQQDAETAIKKKKSNTGSWLAGPGFGEEHRTPQASRL
jgi:hypothetical protein